MERSRRLSHDSSDHSDHIRHLYRDSNERSRLHGSSKPDGDGQHDPDRSHYPIRPNDLLYSRQRDADSVRRRQLFMEYRTSDSGHHSRYIRHLYSNGNECSGLHSVGKPDGDGQYDPGGSYHAIGTNNILYP